MPNHILTFKEYVASKDRLREAVENTPQRKAEYTVRKYCKLVIGESKDHKEYISLKPKQKIYVDWLYEDVDNPTPVNIKFANVKNVNEGDEYLTFWKGERLLNWLHKNAFDESI